MYLSRIFKGDVYPHDILVSSVNLKRTQSKSGDASESRKVQPDLSNSLRLNFTKERYLSHWQLVKTKRI